MLNLMVKNYSGEKVIRVKTGNSIYTYLLNFSMKQFGGL